MTTSVIPHSICDPPQKSCILKIPRNRNRVSRQLFGPVDHEETRRFLEKELGLDNLINEQKWDFDFLKQKPIQHSDAKYKWTKVITFAPRRPSRPEPEPDNIDLYPMPLPIRAEDDEQKLLQAEGEKEDRNHSRKEKMTSKQSQITDFMSIRKRKPSESLTKKTTQSVIPAKISKHDNITS